MVILVPSKMGVIVESRVVTAGSAERGSTQSMWNIMPTWWGNMVDIVGRLCVPAACSSG